MTRQPVCAFGLQYMHSLNIDIEKMEEEIRQLNVESTNAVAENKGKDDHWQKVSLPTMAKCPLLDLHGQLALDPDGLLLTFLTGDAAQIKVNTMERVDKLASQDKQLQADIENTQLLIKRLDSAARGICR